MAEIFLELHASGAPGPHRRAWRIHVGGDLFGHWFAHVTFGRVGAVGRTMRWNFDGARDAARFVRRSLRRRATAPRRIGLAYGVVEASAETLLAAAGLVGPVLFFPASLATGRAIVTSETRETL